MKKTLGFCFVLLPFIFTACQKELSMNTNGQPVPASPNQPLTPDPEPGTLVVKRVDTWSGDPSPSIDSFEYDGNRRLTAEYLLLDQQYNLHYDRDDQQRITRITRTTNGNAVYVNVLYRSGGSNQIAYTVIPIQNGGNTLQDSSVYTYNGEGRISKITRYESSNSAPRLAGYSSFLYDAENNLASLNSYLADALGHADFNIGYEFTYDDKVNPFFAGDDALLSDNWYISASPHNLVKQVNHYSGIAPLPDDFIELSYTYAADGRPGTAKRSGPAIGTSVVNSVYTYK